MSVHGPLSALKPSTWCRRTCIRTKRERRGTLRGERRWEERDTSGTHVNVLSGNTLSNSECQELPGIFCPQVPFDNIMTGITCLSKNAVELRASRFFQNDSPFYRFTPTVAGTYDLQVRCGSTLSRCGPFAHLSHLRMLWTSLRLSELRFRPDLRHV